MKHVDLFCGIGGFSEALKGSATPYIACDIDPKARAVYLANFKPEMMFADLKDLLLDGALHGAHVDILTAGIPCQPYSVMGKKKGLEDKRSDTVGLLMEAIEQAKPDHIILECVPSFGPVFHKLELKKKLESLGYRYFQGGFLNGYDFDNPTLRRRWYMHISRSKILRPWPNPMGLDFVPRIPITLSKLLSKNFEKSYAYTFRKGGQGSGINSRHNWDSYLVDGEPYVLTARDCLRIMGFGADFKIPESISERQMKSLAGNSLCVYIPRWIARMGINCVYIPRGIARMGINFEG